MSRLLDGFGAHNDSAHFLKLARRGPSDNATGPIVSTPAARALGRRRVYDDDMMGVDERASSALNLPVGRSILRFWHGLPATAACELRLWSPAISATFRCFGSIAPGVAADSSWSFVRQPEGNGVAERLIRTLKENLLWVRTFKTIEDLRAELVAFARRYNETWLVARHGYKTPTKVREEQTMPRLVIDPTLAAILPLAA